MSSFGALRFSLRGLSNVQCGLFDTVPSGWFARSGAAVGAAA
jgi:hypothetical protein